MALYLLQDDPSMGRRRGARPSIWKIAAERNIKFVVEATPSGRVVLPSGKGKGSAVCPYTLSVPKLPKYDSELFAFGEPLFENAYQAAKVAPWTCKHTQMLNGKAVLKRGEFTLPFDDAQIASTITSGQAWTANKDVINEILSSSLPIRSQYPKHLRKHIIGSIDWRDRRAPLLDYATTRECYGEMFADCINANTKALHIISGVKEALAAGESVVICETDGPCLEKREDYLAAGVEDFAADGLLRVTTKAWDVVSADLSRCFGHCWHLARMVLRINHVAPVRRSICEDTFATLVLRTKAADKAFHEAKKEKARETRKRNRDEQERVVGGSSSSCSGHAVT